MAMVIPISFAVPLISTRRQFLRPNRMCCGCFQLMLFTQHTNAPLGSGLVASARRLEGTPQRQQAFASQLDVVSGDPYVVTCRYRLFLKLDAQLVLLDPPFAGSLAPH